MYACHLGRPTGRLPPALARGKAAIAAIQRAPAPLFNSFSNGFAKGAEKRR